MPNNSESQCYFVQLQIDSFLDGELSEVQRDDFTSHVKQCDGCAREFHYAQMVQDAVLDLPQMDCDELVLEPVYRLASGGHSTSEGDRKFSWSQIAGLFNAAPVFLRYGFPVVLLVVLAVSIGAPVFSPEQNAALMTEQAAIEQGEQYSPAELYQALQDLNLAIEYLNKVGQRTEVLIGDRFLVTPLQDALNASFERAGNRRSRSLQDDPLQNDPI